MSAHPYDYTAILRELNELIESGKGHRLTISDIDLLDEAWAAIKTLQARVEVLIPLVQTARDLIAKAMDTHIYNEADGESPDANCPYVKFLEDADHAL